MMLSKSTRSFLFYQFLEQYYRNKSTFSVSLIAQFDICKAFDTFYIGFFSTCQSQPLDCRQEPDDCEALAHLAVFRQNPIALNYVVIAFTHIALDKFSLARLVRFPAGVRMSGCGARPQQWLDNGLCSLGLGIKAVVEPYLDLSYWNPKLD